MDIIVAVIFIGIYIYGYHITNKSSLKTKGQAGEADLSLPWFKFVHILSIPLTFVCLISDRISFLASFQLFGAERFFVIGFTMMCVGAVMFLWSIRALGTNYSPCYEAHSPSFVEMNGPYKFIRHPIYMGNLIFLTGVILFTGNIVMVLVGLIILGAYQIVTKKEETYLTNKFLEYGAYKSRTGRFFPKLVFSNRKTAGN